MIDRRLVAAPLPAGSALAGPAYFVYGMPAHILCVGAVNGELFAPTICECSNQPLSLASINSIVALCFFILTASTIKFFDSNVTSPLGKVLVFL